MTSSFFRGLPGSHHHQRQRNHPWCPRASSRSVTFQRGLLVIECVALHLGALRAVIGVPARTRVRRRRRGGGVLLGGLTCGLANLLYGNVDLAGRVGVSENTMRKIERGDPTVGLGVTFEAATIVGVALFDEDTPLVERELRRVNDRLALLPKAVHKVTPVNANF